MIVRNAQPSWLRPLALLAVALSCAGVVIVVLLVAEGRGREAIGPALGMVGVLLSGAGVLKNRPQCQ